MDMKPQKQNTDWAAETVVRKGSFSVPLHQCWVKNLLGWHNFEVNHSANKNLKLNKTDLKTAVMACGVLLLFISLVFKRWLFLVLYCFSSWLKKKKKRKKVKAKCPTSCTVPFPSFDVFGPGTALCRDKPVLNVWTVYENSIHKHLSR